MNKLKKLLFVIAFTSGTMSFAQESTQNAESAQITSPNCLTLNAEAELTQQYVADATPLNWESAAAAKKWCGYNSNNLVTYSADYANNKLLITIHTERTGESKDLTWWNNYLTSRCK